MRRALPLSLTLALVTACATTIERQAREAATGGIDPAPLISLLEARFDAVEATKRIFDLTLIEGRRRFGGEGVVQYRSEPRRLRVDIFGPQSTPVLRVTLVDDWLTVFLPREGEMLAGRLGDPRFATLAGERALASPEMLGAILGVYDLAPLLEEVRLVSAGADGDRQTLYIVRSDAVHAFTVAPVAGAPQLVEYRQGREGHLAYRARFERYAPVDGRSSPRRVVMRDFVKERSLVVDVTREHEDVPADPIAAPAR